MSQDLGWLSGLDDYINKFQKTNFQSVKCRSDTRRESNNKISDLTKKFTPE